MIESETGRITPRFAEYNLHAFSCLPLSQLLNALCNLPRWIDTKQLLEPFAGICLAVDVLPVPQFSRAGGIDFLVDLGATIIFYPVLNGSDSDDKYEGECRSLRGGGAKHGKHWERISPHCRVSRQHRAEVTHPGGRQVPRNRCSPPYETVRTSSLV